MRQPALIVMVKEPRAGRVKTRLGRDIGATAAANWYRHQTAATLRNLRDPRWQIVLAVAPDQAVPSRAWPRDLPRFPQGRGDLGHRMARALKTTPGPTLLIGSDIPGITRRHIAEAFGKLRCNQSVIGPATDGGFWLIGLQHPRQAPKTLFRDVRWSHPETLADTLPTLPNPTGLTETLSDIDTGQDLRATLPVTSPSGHGTGGHGQNSDKSRNP